MQVMHSDASAYFQNRFLLPTWYDFDINGFISEFQQKIVVCHYLARMLTRIIGFSYYGKRRNFQYNIFFFFFQI